MNIFVLDNDPVKAAQYMDCVRVPKMCVESAQMMASALRRYGATDDIMPLTQKGTPYKGGYHHHPCTIQCGNSLEDFMWLAEHAIALCYEYSMRFNKTHACEGPIRHMKDVIQGKHYGKQFAPNWDYDSKTPFAQAMPDEYKDEDADKAYRAYYKSKASSAGGVHYRHVSAPDWWQGVEVTA